MTLEEAVQILGPELAEKIRAEGRADKPLTREQIKLLTGLFLGAEAEAARRQAERDVVDVVDDVA